MCACIIWFSLAQLSVHPRIRCVVNENDDDAIPLDNITTEQSTDIARVCPATKPNRYCDDGNYVDHSTVNNTYIMYMYIYTTYTTVVRILKDVKIHRNLRLIGILLLNESDELLCTSLCFSVFGLVLCLRYMYCNRLFVVLLFVCTIGML